MSDIYKIAVHMAVSSNAHGFFSSLAGQVFHLHGQVDKLEKKILGMSRMKLAIGGGISMALGIGMLEGLTKTVEAAAELNKQLVTTQSLLANTKTNPRQSEALADTALQVARRTTRNVNGVLESRAVEIFNETHGVFGPENAAKANESLALYAKVSGAIAGHDPEKGYASIRELAKALEMSGKIMDEKTHLIDVNKLENYLGIAAKMEASSAGRINAKTFMQIIGQSSTAVKGMNDEGLQSLLMASQQMGGFKVGTATMSLFQQFAGGKITGSVAAELQRLGLVGSFKKEGGGVKFGPGQLDTEFTRKLEKDPLSAIEVLRKAMASHGITNQDAQVKEMFNIFGRQTTIRLMTDFMTNAENMLAEKGRIQGAMGLREQSGLRDDKDFSQNVNNMEVAWHNLMAEVGLPMTALAIDYMKKTTDALKWMKEAAIALGPDTIQNIAKGIAALGIAFIGAGATALLLALGPAGWMVLGIGAVTAALIAFKAPLDAFVARMDAFLAKVKGWVSNMFGGGKSPSDTSDSSLEYIPQAYRGSGGGLLHNMAYVTGASNDNASNVIALGTKTGFLDAMQQLGAGGPGGGGGGLGGGGFMTASYGGGGGRSWGGRALPVGTGFGLGHAASATERADFIRKTAASLGIDPNVALRVAQSEGFYKYTGDHGMSFGDFQMYTGGGLGNVALANGIDIRDPKNWRAADRLALQIAANKKSWADWHGAARVGIGNGEGFGIRPYGPPPSTQRDITVHAPIHLDGEVIARNQTRHRANSGQFPTSVGGPDTHGHFTNPGTPLLDSA